MADWLNIAEIVRVNAQKYRGQIALSDERRRFTFAQVDERISRLARGLMKLGLKKGDRVAILLENCIEICEAYFAAARAGFVAVPVSFRYTPADTEYVINHSDARALIVHDEFVPLTEDIRPRLKKIGKTGFICVRSSPDSAIPKGYREYEAFLLAQKPADPGVKILPKDIWIQLYTSGTTGRPKGVLRTHESYTAFYLINGVDFGFSEHDVVLNVMPLYHVNATFFSFSVTYVGGRIHIFPARNFQAVGLLDAIDRHKITFVSLIPTHYNLILALPEEVKRQYDVSSINKLLCSSAPARSETKKGVLQFFPGAQLFEGYGSTEAGIVTTLKPYEQLTKLGSIGKESCGTDTIKVLDAKRRPVKPGEIGELFSRGPMMFSGYYKAPDLTKKQFEGEYFSAGDMARQDDDGYYYLVDRKHNMIITGGEHVFPSEVEEVLCCHPGVFEAAVVGLPHVKWGEEVTAVVICKDGVCLDENAIVVHCRDRLASFKTPKKVIFVSNDEMPRTPTGKILHRVLRERFGKSG
ncbi:MAG: AMP-binding protein [Deltaproteobacteria bacterium]|nr:AMP-binding protein [Deltaproteobacteria bacterium]